MTRMVWNIALRSIAVQTRPCSESDSSGDNVRIVRSSKAQRTRPFVKAVKTPTSGTTLLQRTRVLAVHKLPVPLEIGEVLATFPAVDIAIDLDNVRRWLHCIIDVAIDSSSGRYRRGCFPVAAAATCEADSWLRFICHKASSVACDGARLC